MSVSAFRKMMANPDGFAERAAIGYMNMVNPEYWRTHPEVPALGIAGIATGALGIGSSIASSANPDNEGLERFAQTVNTIYPFVDTAGEYVVNRHVMGMSQPESVYKAGLSGVGQIGGQYLARKYLLPKDEEGNVNEFLAGLAGAVGEGITDLVAETSYPSLAQKMKWAKPIL